VTRRKKNEKKIGFEPISSKFGTLEAEKITLFPAIIFQLFFSFVISPPREGFVKLANYYASHRIGDCCRLVIS